MTAGLTTLNVITSQSDFYPRLSQRTAALIDGIQEAGRAAGIPIAANQAGTMACDTARFSAFFRAMLTEGIYLAPSAFEVGFLSAAHGDAEIEATIEAARKALRTL